MDETPVVPGRTIDGKGKKTIKVRTTGSEKRHITVVLAASGNILPPMIIFKGKTDRTVKNLRIPDGFVVATQSKAWMDVDYGVPFVSKLLRRRHLTKGSMFSKGIDV